MGAALSRAVECGRARMARVREAGPQDRECDGEPPGQPEGEPGHRERFVLPEVHVVDVDDVDDRDGEGGDQDGDRHGAEDGRNQRDDKRDGQARSGRSADAAPRLAA